MTEQRRIVYNIVMQACDHPTAEEIYEQAKKLKPGIAMGTVYRNLGILADEGQILHIHMPDGPDRYDKTLRRHEHMECIVCGSVVDAELGNLTDMIAERSGLEIHSYELSLRGVCPNCREEIRDG